MVDIDSGKYIMDKVKGFHCNFYLVRSYSGDDFSELCLVQLPYDTDVQEYEVVTVDLEEIKYIKSFILKNTINKLSNISSKPLNSVYTSAIDKLLELLNEEYHRRFIWKK